MYITDSNGTFVTPNLKGRDGEGSNVTIDVDDEMSDTSENVVQNKVIKSYIDDKFANTNKVQSDWNESDTSSEAFILNKPIIPSEYDDTLVTSRLETIEVDNSTLKLLLHDTKLFLKIRMNGFNHLLMVSGVEIH